MPLRIDHHLRPQRLVPHIHRLFDKSAEKILSIEKHWNPSKGTPVFTVKGKYTTRGWTEWTQGFQFGSAVLQFEVSGENRFRELARSKTVEWMATHVSHIGVHDHGFNNVSTYGNLLRLMGEGRIPFNPSEQHFYELALKVSGAVQAARWTQIEGDGGFVYSFNGPHSLFIDTMRSMRSLAIAHRLGHVLMGERDERISLLSRLIKHAEATAKHGVYYGNGRDIYDVRGRTAHESLFNVNDGSYRCPNSQQGYSPFSTWTRGLAWAVLGFSEQLEFLDTVSDGELNGICESRSTASLAKNGGKKAREIVSIPANADAVRNGFLKAATATADFYIENSCADGVPMWDTGAANLNRLGDYLKKPSDPYNAWEPVDSSAAAIAAQGLIRLGHYLASRRDTKNGDRYRQAGLTVANTLLNEPYVSANPKHQGLILHSVYHRPNGWDWIAPGQKVPNGESSMWGDYHARELSLMILREAKGEPYLTFFSGIGGR
ncbi:MAG: glycosyl hydrolase [Verrucomicrobia bacterium]|nr:glycosyl hydrolase [Verrucomicrobiota bacterium]